MKKIETLFFRPPQWKKYEEFQITSCLFCFSTKIEANDVSSSLLTLKRIKGPCVDPFFMGQSLGLTCQAQHCLTSLFLIINTFFIFFKKVLSLYFN
jgi:hypothetical protein